MQDVNATLANGFSGLKVDGCGAQRDIALWYGLFNQSLRRAAGASPMLLEQCHDDDGLPQVPLTLTLTLSLSLSLTL